MRDRYRRSPFLSNLLLTVAESTRRTATPSSAIRPSKIGTPVENFLVLPRPSALPASPDTALTYAAQPLTSSASTGTWSVSVARTFWLTAQTSRRRFWASADTVQVIPATGVAPHPRLSRQGGQADAGGRTDGGLE